MTESDRDGHESPTPAGAIDEVRQAARRISAEVHKVIVGQD